MADAPYLADLPTRLPSPLTGSLQSGVQQRTETGRQLAGEFAAINAARIASKADNEIRDLVARLEAEPKECLR